MALKGLRYVLLLSLVAATIWVAAGARTDAASDTVSPLPGENLCIHRSGS
ncbi:MAG: hypothetical protein OEY85_14775 [Rhodospirillales bacterium]|nr:hypothetical protein [Rhodospirillales bacterium]